MQTTANPKINQQHIHSFSSNGIAVLENSIVVINKSSHLRKSTNIGLLKLRFIFKKYDVLN